MSKVHYTTLQDLNAKIVDTHWGRARRLIWQM